MSNTTAPKEYDEGRAARDAQRKADEQDRKDNPDTPASAVGYGDPDLAYGDHFNQRFGNLPANPKMAPGIDPEANLVKIAHKTNNLPGVGSAIKWVPKEMVGDYCRAGWHVADLSDEGGGGDDVGQGTGPTDDAAGRKATKLTEDVQTGKVEVDHPNA